MNKEITKGILIKYNTLISRVYRILGRNKYYVNGGGSCVCRKGTYLWNCRFNIKGSNNKVVIESGLTRMQYCNIIIKGNNCSVEIGKDSNLNYTTLYLEDDDCKISIGEHVTVTGKTNLAVIEGKKIVIGNDCLFSADIEFRVGDSHSIIERETRRRINPSKDIIIGNHVWIGHGVKILKGSNIANNSIIATGAIVTGKKFQSNAVIAGIPAKVIHEGIDWQPERIPMGNN